jgi:predicted nuclease of predicted toxin-antitoxin system
VKLFFDENLSPALIERLISVYTGSSHVRNDDMVGSTDSQIWNFCKNHDFIIVTKDNDFRERSFTEGAPPKIIWLDVGNAGTDEIADLLSQSYLKVDRFASQPGTSLLILSISGDII